jgi:anthranilate phosphoribosyltransferase
MGIRTVFNILGPLTNPAGAQAQVLGVGDPALPMKMAEVLSLLGSHHALVVHSMDGLDEISLCDATLVYELKGMSIQHYVLHPEELGLHRCDPAAIKGGTAQENAAMLRGVLQEQSGPLRDMTVLNAAAALVVGDLAPNVKDAIPLAQRAIDSGAALEKLEGLTRVSQSFV